jgi:hypothetical protein
VSVLPILRTLPGACYHCPHVQFWEAESGWRLGGSHRGGHRGDIPCLVDASDVRTVNGLKTRAAWYMSEIAMLRQPWQDVRQH